MLDKQGYKFLDLRGEIDFDFERLTKPPRCSINAPITALGPGGEEVLNADFVSIVTSKLPKSAKALVVGRSDGIHTWIGMWGWVDVPRQAEQPSSNRFGPQGP